MLSPTLFNATNTKIISKLIIFDNGYNSSTLRVYSTHSGTLLLGIVWLNRVPNAQFPPGKQKEEGRGDMSEQTDTEDRIQFGLIT